MNFSVLSLLFIVLPQAASECRWRFSWSESVPSPLPADLHLPPSRTDCALFVADALVLVNSGGSSQLLRRVRSEAALVACDSSEELLPRGGSSLSVAPRSSYSISLSRGTKNPWDFVVCRSYELIGAHA